MEHFLGVVHVGLAIVVSFVLSALGGMDSWLSLIITLIGVDIILGLLNACIKKELDYRIMKKGLASKFCTIFIIVISAKLDALILATIGEVPVIFGVHIYIRTFFIAWFCIAELISLCETATKLGVPLPKWLKGMLIQVRDCASDSAYKLIISFIKSKLNAGNTNKNKDSDSGGI